MSRKMTNVFQYAGVAIYATYEEDEDGVHVCEVMTAGDMVRITPLVSKAVIERCTMKAIEAAQHEDEAARPDRHYTDGGE